MSRLPDAFRDRRIVLDAAMGTRLLKQGLDLNRDDPCLWNLSRPDLVHELHRRDALAGADAILTNTFGANRLWLTRFGRATDADRINAQAVILAREAAGSDRFILGSLGPTGLESPADYLQQAETLARAGVDVLILETHSIRQALDGLGWLRERLNLPILVSLFLDSEETPTEKVFTHLQSLGADALGVNCVSPGVARLQLKKLERAGVSLPLLALPSALPAHDPFNWRNALGLAPETAQEDRLSDRVRFLGGCCGTDDRHVRLLRDAVDRLTQI